MLISEEAAGRAAPQYRDLRTVELTLKGIEQPLPVRVMQLGPATPT